MGRIKISKKCTFRKKENNKQIDQLLQRAFNLHRTGKFSEARKAYEEILEVNPQNSDALGNLGLLLHSESQTVNAVEYYQKALALAPQLDHLHYYLGNGLNELGLYEEAIVAYEKALSTRQNSLHTKLNLGLAYKNIGHLTKARDCFESILRQVPDFTQAAYHLGLLSFEQERYQEAADCFASVLSNEADNVDACFNLGLTYKAMGQNDRANYFLQKAAQLAPDDSDIIYNIGVLQKELGDYDKAEATFLKALQIKPDNGICLTDLSILYHIQNRLEEASLFYQRALDVGYHTDAAEHMLAALRGETTAAAPKEYIVDLFNNYAKSFDHCLIHDLHYDIPAQLAQFFQEYCNKPVESALDVGCGTGLSGAPFLSLTRHLTGVDLSSDMLAIAKKKQIYDELHCCEAIDFLQKASNRFSLIIAADVLAYLGQLESFFPAIYKALSPDGFLLFSVERCSGEGYRLRQSGRYAHSKAYIAKLAKQFDFKIRCHQEKGIRKERGEWIPGDIYLLQV